MTQNIEQVHLRKTTTIFNGHNEFFLFIYINLVNLFSRYSYNNRDTYIVTFFLGIEFVNGRLIMLTSS